MPRCIYCREAKSEDCFRKAEHVMPQSYGKFEKNLTLHGVVCDDCNQYFGDTLELVLGRDTYEGHARFRHGVKKAEDFKPLRNQRVTFKLAEGPFAGAHAYTKFVEEAGEIQVFPLPQVGFLLAPTNQYQYFLLTDIPAQDELRAQGFDGNVPRSIMSLGTEPEIAKLALAEKGIDFNIGGEPLPPPAADTSPKDIGVDMALTIDDIVLRAVAKIAFNYLAKWQGAEFALHPAFVTIRRFIRYGERRDYPLIQVAQEAILGDEPIEGNRRLGNLVATGIATDGVSIFAQVSLLNHLTYRVALGREFPGAIPADIMRGHFFNVTNQQILELDPRRRDPSSI
jgi:hypothetical protein